MDALRIETHTFDYPNIQELLDFLNQFSPINFREGGICEILRNDGLVDVEDFTLISPRSLYRSTKISPEKLLLLYAGAEHLIKLTHTNMQEDIDSILEAKLSFSN